MGIKDTFGAQKEQCLQLYFRDDRQLTFRPMPVTDGFVTEMERDKVIKAWLMPYRVLKRYDGKDNKSATMLLLSYGRDIVLDPFNQLAPNEKPEAGDRLVKNFISNIATSVFYKHEKGPKHTDVDRMVWFIGFTMIILTVIILIVSLKGVYSG